MSMLGLLPQRWRTQPGDPHVAEDLVGVLETPPVTPTGPGLALCVRAGSQQLLPLLVSLKSLLWHLGRGRCVIIDDGTLTGSDRTILAHHLGDPPILARGAIGLGAFPKECEWESLLCALDGRGGEYWLLPETHCVTLAPVREMASAIAANRSLSGPGVLGLAAGGPGRPVAEAIMAAAAESGQSLHDLLLAREAVPVTLPAERYRTAPPKKALQACAFAAFGKCGVRAASAHSAASRIALAAIGG